MDTVSFSWKLPNQNLLVARFAFVEEAYEETQDRLIGQLGRLLQVSLVNLDPDHTSLLEGLTGRWVQIPSEAKLGLTLPLKYDTLHGKIRYFYWQDPRTLPKPNKK